MAIETDVKTTDPAKSELRAQIAAEVAKNEAASKKSKAAAPVSEAEEFPEDDVAEDEPADGDPEPEPAEPADGDGDPEPEDDDEEEAAEAPAPKAEAQPEKVAKGLAALAQRDAESRRAHQARVAELAEYERRITAGAQQQRTQIEQEVRAQVRRQALEDPVGFYRALGVDKGYQDLGAQFYYAELGADAPKEIQDKARFYGVQQKISDVERQLQDQAQALAQREANFQMQQRVSAYKGALLAELPKIKDAPYLGALAKKSGDAAANAMIAAANDWMKENPGQPAPSATVLAARVEKVLQETLEPFKGVLPKAPTPAADEDDEPATTLSANHSGLTPTTKTTPKSREDRKADIVRVLNQRRRSRPTK
jgi:hypothetical protein